MKVIKRDGRAVEYNNNKIKIAIEKANQEVSEEKRATSQEINQITDYIETLDKKRILVEDIQDIIEQKLMEIGRYDLAKKYIVYRYTRALVRKQNTTDESILGLIKNASSVSINGEDTPIIASVQRNLIAGEVSKDLTKRMLLPEKITKAHEDGVIHFHATDYFLQPIINSCLVNIGDMLDNGTVINGQDIETPKSFQVACIVTTQIIAAIASSQYGEQYINVKHLGKYLRKSYEKLKNELKEFKTELSDELVEKLVDKRLKNELASGVQTIQYQINTLITTYGKAPIVTLILELDEKDEYIKENTMIVKEILKQRSEELKNNNKTGKEFSKFICNFEDEELINIAKKCNAQINIQDIENYQYEGHFNQGVVSINLPQIALDSNKDEKTFWKLLDERLEICYEALMCRHYALLGIMSDVSPIHWQNGAIARLQTNERIDKLLKDGYSDITLGYVGLEQTVKVMLGDLVEEQSEKNKLNAKIIKFLEDKVQKWKKMTGIDFVVCRDENVESCFSLFEVDKVKYGRVLNENDVKDYWFE